MILNCGLRARSENLNRLGSEGKFLQASGVNRLGLGPVFTHPFTQVFEVSLNSMDFGLGKSLLKFLYGFFPVFSMNEDFGE